MNIQPIMFDTTRGPDECKLAYQRGALGFHSCSSSSQDQGLVDEFRGCCEPAGREGEQQTRLRESRLWNPEWFKVSVPMLAVHTFLDPSRRWQALGAQRAAREQIVAHSSAVDTSATAGRVGAISAKAPCTVPVGRVGAGNIAHAPCERDLCSPARRWRLVLGAPASAGGRARNTGLRCGSVRRGSQRAGGATVCTERTRVASTTSIAVARVARRLCKRDEQERSPRLDLRVVTKRVGVRTQNQGNQSMHRNFISMSWIVDGYAPRCVCVCMPTPARDSRRARIQFTVSVLSHVRDAARDDRAQTVGASGRVLGIISGHPYVVAIGTPTATSCGPLRGAASIEALPRVNMRPIMPSRRCTHANQYARTVLARRCSLTQCCRRGPGCAFTADAERRVGDMVNSLHLQLVRRFEAATVPEFGESPRFACGFGVGFNTGIGSMHGFGPEGQPGMAAKNLPFDTANLPNGSEIPRVMQHPAGDPYGFGPVGWSGTVLTGTEKIIACNKSGFGEVLRAIAVITRRWILEAGDVQKSLLRTDVVDLPDASPI
ncbi:hypothetical protein C8R45DRAFT_928634 [Mycena sanguinolenta]|nr:hypothetical protein C8R45DRAFT_928634 [Mycena sanguinolenta]